MSLVSTELNFFDFEDIELAPSKRFINIGRFDALFCTFCDAPGQTAHIHGCARSTTLQSKGGCGGAWYCQDCSLHILCGGSECAREHHEYPVRTMQREARNGR